MKINEILTESQQLDEGPIGSAVGAVGRGVGKAIGGVAKAAGAIGGVWQGAKNAFSKGKQAAIDTISGNDAAATANSVGTAAPAPQGGGAAAPAQQPAAAAPTPAAAPSVQDINQQGPKGTAPAKAQTGAAAAALQKTAQATAGANAEKAGQTVYAQVKSQINNLDKKGKQRILQLLQKSIAAPAADAAAAPAAAAKSSGSGVGKVVKKGIDAVTNAAGKTPLPQATDRRDFETPGAAPATAAPAAPAQQPAAAAPAAEPAPKKKRGGKKAAAPSQAEIDADRNRLMGVTSDSVIRTGNSLAETLAQKVELHKRKMFESSLAKGETSIFKK